MSRRTWNQTLLGLAVAMLLLTMVLQPHHDKPNFEFLPDMAHQPRCNAFEASPWFSDERTLRTPVAHTIARGKPPLHYDSTPESAARAGQELVSPIKSDSAPARARGKALFEVFCTPCHGRAGQGDGPVALRGFPPPASLRAEKATKMRAGQIFHIITYGQGNMPAYASQITREDRWRVILFLRTLQQQQPSPSVTK